MNAFRVFLRVWVQLRAVVCIHPVLLVDAAVHKQTWGSRCAPLFPNPSIDPRYNENRVKSFTRSTTWQSSDLLLYSWNHLSTFETWPHRGSNKDVELMPLNPLCVCTTGLQAHLSSRAEPSSLEWPGSIPRVYLRGPPQ